MWIMDVYCRLYCFNVTNYLHKNKKYPSYILTNPFYLSCTISVQSFKYGRYRPTLSERLSVHFAEIVNINIYFIYY